ncbi:MAG: sigma-70 family RNA polymerase sigma factor [Phaeodactylibacter sp.]|nr:sigma-70 family RNA polymerase sigma factor [Phaeodactylibacter sp.]MCB9303027.1 sigma-70 family RNA polymerase sigma factor [Lewinellaceae bacterium]
MVERTSPTSPDQEIIHLLEQRDQRAVTMLYEHYSGALYGIILRIVGSEVVAEEALQEALLKIWQKAEQYDPEKGRLFTWMAQLCRNTAVDTLRSSQFKKGNKTESLPDIVYNNSALSENPVTSDPALRKVVGQLEEKNRQIIDLLYFQDLTQKEASEALGIPLGTVKTRARKAMEQLRKVLSNELLWWCAISLTTFELMISYLGH